ncbi:MAG: 1,4-alpha-glucan branching protein GlgB [Candidatus Limnocylindria bacterium]
MTVTARDDLIGEADLHLFNEGTHRRLHERLGAHLRTVGGRSGVTFSVWAPNAEHVSVIGDWNRWDDRADRLSPIGASGIWSGFVPGVAAGARYKYLIRSRQGGYRVSKADPFASRAELPPGTASVVWDLAYEWGDREWVDRRSSFDPAARPMAIYEVHAGSWMRDADGRMLGYRELAPRLAEHLRRGGFTHVEFLPLAEHPFYGSWGYQSTGYFAPTSRYGTPQDLMWLIDTLHQEGFGVIFDWVPSHFPDDEHGLVYFDGTHLYEHADPRRGRHPDWDSYTVNYGRHEVRAFLISSAVAWLERYHADGLRVDAVASMLYLDYSRKPGEWVPNRHGGREDLEAVDLLRAMNDAVHGEVPGALTIAEESQAWPGVTAPTSGGGLGFDMKWDLGWMNDTLRYLSRDPIRRPEHHEDLTFRLTYAFGERYVLPLSHDEVAHDKGSLLAKMHGDDWQKLASLRLLLAYQCAQPGKKLLFQGQEFAQRAQWDHDRSIDWHLLEQPDHQAMLRCVAHLWRTYAGEPALHETDFDHRGFEWVVVDDREQSVLSFLRWDRSGRRPVLAVFNFTPVTRHGYRLGVPRGGRWTEIVNTDARDYGGSGVGNAGGAQAVPFGSHGRPYSLTLELPPLAAVFLAAG